MTSNAHPEDSSPLPSASTTGGRPAEDRDRYADVGLAVRYSRTLLEASSPSSLTRRVWEAVAVDLLASWSRLTEAREHLGRDVCRLVGLDPESRGNRSKVGAALGELSRSGALGYRPGIGAERAVVTLPAPPDDWTDPTCGLTAGDLRERRRRAEEGVTYPPGETPSPTPQVTRSEEPCEEPPTAHHEPDTPPVDDQGEGEEIHLDDQAQALLDGLLELLGDRVARHARPRRRILLKPCRAAQEAGHTAATLATAVLAHDRKRGPLDALNDPDGTAGAIAWRIRNAEAPPRPRSTAQEPDAPACATCEGAPLVERDDGTYETCPTCRPGVDLNPEPRGGDPATLGELLEEAHR